MLFSGFLGFNRVFSSNKKAPASLREASKVYAVHASKAPKGQMRAPFVCCAFFSNAFGHFQNTLPQSTPQYAPRKCLSKLWSELYIVSFSNCYFMWMGTYVLC